MRSLDAQLLRIVVYGVFILYYAKAKNKFPFYANLMYNKVDVHKVLHDGTILLELGC